MKRFYVLILILSYQFSTAQNPNFAQCPQGDDSCGPMQNQNKRRAINGDVLQQTPYSFILHQEIKRGKTSYSTGSFISPTMIITAHHNVFHSRFIRRLAFCNKAVNPDQWVRFKRKEVDIIKLGGVRAPTDIAIIKFKDPEKIKILYNGHFQLGTIDNLSDSVQIHLTGFPCDLPDILVDKNCSGNELNLHKTETLIGYALYTCTGDSGAPLWFMNEDTATLVGIHHGGGEGNFEDDTLNCSAKVTQGVIDWVAKATRQH